MRTLSIHVLAAGLLSAAANIALAAHPLVTDDTGTQDKGNHQIEFNTDWSRTLGATTRVAAFTYTYGVAPAVDVFLNLPGTVSAPAGINDISLGAKWRFHDGEAFSYGIKPELILPSGNADKALGNGRTGAALTLLASHDAEPWSFHANLGWTLNRYQLPSVEQASRRVLWRASAAAVYQVSEQIRLVADIGAARNEDRSDRTPPAFVLIGAVYSPRRDVDIDFGWKAGANHAEADRQFGAGLTLRF